MAKKTFGIILNILIGIAVLIVFILIYNVIVTKIAKKDYANYFGFSFFQVATGSMSPTMEEKDIIIVHVLNEDEIKELQVDDIIIFKQEKAMVTHRIVKIEEEKITTKGDANNAIDIPINRNEIIGKIVKIIPNIGIWEKVFTTPQVYISIIITITLFGITLSYNPKEIVNIDGEKTDEKK